ncbi:hypothetical protein D7I39_12810 [Allopusillimonas ginsengisoli]|nr:hypothetical protein D7I39_12810 [Allopusillimonas ginsengisoli]
MKGISETALFSALLMAMMSSTSVQASAFYGAKGGAGGNYYYRDSSDIGTGGPGGATNEPGASGSGAGGGEAGGAAGTSENPMGGDGLSSKGIPGGGGGGGYSNVISGDITASISGGNGGGGRDAGGGGGGGDGVRNTDSSPTISVSADVSGGRGGDANVSMDSGGGGGGGAGIVLESRGGITIHGSVTIAGGEGGSDDGGGGAGIVFNAGGSLTNGGRILGGMAGEGGRGAAGVVSQEFVEIVNSGSIHGAAASGPALAGAAIDLKAGGSISNTSGGVLAGGAGNKTSSGGTNTPAGGSGSGGAAGGTGASGFGYPVAAIIGADVSIINAGTITGGEDSYFGQANAITFTGGANQLELQSGSILSGNLAIDGGGSLALHQSSDQTLSNRITGDGSVVKTGTGTLTLSMTNTYTGGTVFKAGTLVIGEDGRLGDALGGLTFDGGILQTSASMTSSRDIRLNAGGGTIQMGSGISSTFSGVISDGTGAGRLTKAGAGTLTLTGVNTYTGGTAVNNGHLNVNSGATLGSSGAVAVGNAAGGDVASLAFQDGSSAKGLSITNNETGTTTFIGDVATDASTTLVNAGTVDLTDATTDLQFGSLSGPGTVSYGDHALTIGQATGTDTIDGVISATGGLVKTGTNMVILNAVNNFTGGTTVNEGTLEIGDANTPTASIAGDVQVNPQGTLRGHGTVTGNVTNDGVVRPGGSIGTLTIGGNYTQSPGSTLRIDVSPTMASKLQVGGTAQLAGTLDVLYGPGTYTTKSYQIVSAGAVNGTFATVSGNMPTGVTQDIAYSATAVDLSLTAAAPPLPPPDDDVTPPPPHRNRPDQRHYLWCHGLSHAARNSKNEQHTA